MAGGPDARGGGLIGPNALLQLAPVLDRAGGPALRARIFAAGGVSEMPSGDGLMPEGPAARVHQAVRAQLPDIAAAVAREAGRRTGLYILRNRIPPAVRSLLRTLPPGLSARLLSRAIARHAWTFAGSGRFRAAGPWSFEIVDNPIVAGEVAETPVCHWHAAVFETLYRQLVGRRLRCTEVACRAAGATACRFEMTGGPRGGYSAASACTAPAGAAAAAGRATTVSSR